MEALGTEGMVVTRSRLHVRCLAPALLSSGPALFACSMLNPAFDLDREALGESDDLGGAEVGDADADADADADMGGDRGTVGSSVGDDGSDDDGAIACGTDELCVDLAPPSPFMGPFALRPGAGLTVPSCVAPFPDPVGDGFAGPITADPASCSACQCTTFTPSACTGVVATFFDTTFCTDPIASIPLTRAGECNVATVGQGFSGSVTAAAGVATGTCGVTGAVLLDLPPAVAEGSATLCSGSLAPGPACEPEGRCVKLPSGPFSPMLCIAAGSELPCPGTWPRRIELYDDWVDLRACEACGCELSPSACNLELSGWANTSCSGAADALGQWSSAACHAFPGGIGGSSVVGAQVVGIDFDGVACATSGGTPTGTVVPEVHTTVCCVEG